MNKLVFSKACCAILFLTCSYISLSAQNYIYGAGHNQAVMNNSLNSIFKIDVETCSFELIKAIGRDTGIFNQYHLSSFRDIAINQYDEIYLTASTSSFFIGYEYLVYYDQIADTFALFPLPPNDYFLTLTCDRDGNPIIGGLFEVGKFDRINKVYSKIGDSSLGDPPTDDIFFYNDSLFCASFSDIFYLDLNDTPNPSLIWEWPFTGRGIHGATTKVKNCDERNVYLASGRQIDQWDRLTGNATFLCDVPSPYQVWGLASKSEFAEPGCTPKLDLDFDNSSGATASDFRQGLVCTTDVVKIADSDFLLSSLGQADSIVVWFESGNLDGVDEFINAQNIPFNLSFSVDNGKYKLFTPLSNATIGDFQTALSELTYQNTASPFQEGERVLSVVFYANEQASDTARFTVALVNQPEAGIGTPIEVCIGTDSINLTNFLAQNAELGGIWSPVSSSNGFYAETGIVGSDSVFYVVEKLGCPSDTAVFPIEIFPLPVFDLGMNQELCGIDSFLLEVQLPSNTMIEWQNGVTSSTFLVENSGTYSARLESEHGCFFSDTILVEFKDTSMTRAQITRCQGSVFSYNGFNFTSDSTILHTSLNQSGCDSTHLIDLTFYKIIELLDTSVCLGEKIEFLGKYFESPGKFEIEIDTNGCTVFGELTLSHFAVEPFRTEVTICDNDFFLFMGDTIVTTGIYQDTLNTVEFGCDSIVVLDLVVEEIPQLEPKDTSINYGQTLELNLPILNLLSGNYRWEWTPPVGLSCTVCSMPWFQGDSSQVYEVVVESAKGCLSTSQYVVNVEKENTDTMKVYIPNVFNPNLADNDKFGPFVFSELPVEVELFQIFNRWGGLVFEQKNSPINNQNLFWDGTQNGKKCTTGVYIYKLILSNGKIIHGEVVLVQ